MKKTSIIIGFALCWCISINSRAQEPREPASNYINLEADVVDLSGMIRITYSCDYSAYNYGGIPVHFYLMALRDPRVSDSAASVPDALASGAVQIFRSGMQSVYTYAGIVGAPTLGAIVFPEAPLSGSLLIDMAGENIHPGTLAFAAVLVYADTGEFVRTDGLPVEISNTVTPFRDHVAMLPSTIHVGDPTDPYHHLAGWEVPHPEGLTVRRTFVLETAPTAAVMVQGTIWGTYYANDPVYINGESIGYLLGEKNGNRWMWISGHLSPALFHAGANTITFKSAVFGGNGWDNYMAKGWELYYN